MALNSQRKQPVMEVKTHFVSKLKRESNVTAVDVFLQLFCYANCDDVKSEFSGIRDFTNIMCRFVKKDITTLLMVNHSIQPFLMLNKS